ncbi:metabolite traffic protein EboE [Leptospira harrisiae]|uniref:Xylose isomerase n=1 Tax=Leptospira harrisiae TaxID=2023189 RepID=A0A2N0AIT2_9LEPT|nr:metabolite traffic protein EboE [Leptospira harrisiae]PJZ84212.1 xylose isomerase [Leptospira harrisiae]PKA07873.1 xylose isomerase [Leptospira harrisiae]
MRTKYGHLTYCSNIHPGESWSDHFFHLKSNLPVIRQKVSPNAPMGLGLRIANEASIELLNPQRLGEFKSWLNKEGFYVFLINGFPYGGFHETVVKESVYQPDWTTKDRLDYTLRLFKILSELLPQGMEGGVSTPPLSYFYFDSEESSRIKRKFVATKQIADVTLDLIQIKIESGQTLHLDLEPEPDGILGNVKLWVHWFLEDFLPVVIPMIQAKWDVSLEIAEQMAKNHIRICLDACHAAVSFQDSQMIVKILSKHSILVGRIQISSALKVKFSSETDRLLELVSSFDEPTYLHQVVIQSEGKVLDSYPDLPEAIRNGKNQFVEWRIHFHVPVFLESYGLLTSTQKELLELLNLQKQYLITNALEVETYTWGVLPKELQVPITDSIIRELEWVKTVLGEEL